MSAEDPETRLKRLRIRAWRRGMRETDLLLGNWADQRLAGLGPDELDLFEALLSENDPNIHAWVTGREVAPDRFRDLIADIAQSASQGGGI